MGYTSRGEGAPLLRIGVRSIQQMKTVNNIQLSQMNHFALDYIIFCDPISFNLCKPLMV
jgi:hypothetical protein